MLVFWLCYQTCRCSVLRVVSWHTCGYYEFESSFTCITVRSWHAFLEISKMLSRVACYFVCSMSLVVNETYIPLHVSYQCVQHILCQDSWLSCFYQGYMTHRRDEKIRPSAVLNSVLKKASWLNNTILVWYWNVCIKIK